MSMRVGRFTFGQDRLKILYDHADLTIGSFCSIGCGVTIYLGGEHNHKRVSTYPFGHMFMEEFPCSGEGHPSTKGDVVIGSDVWIADNVTILSGVNIGNGAVIGNSSVVAKDVPPYAIVAGNPAELVRFRFSWDIRERLQNVEWWNLTSSFIKANVGLLCSNDVVSFLEAAETEAMRNQSP